MNRAPTGAVGSDVDAATDGSERTAVPLSDRHAAPASPEAVPRHRREATGVSPIDVSDVLRVDVVDVLLLDDDVVDDARTAPTTPPGVADADASVAAPPRVAGLSPTQRRPPDVSAGESGGHRDAVAVARSIPVEADQRGRIQGARDEGSRRPIPGAVQPDPPAVVERRPSPGSVVQPGPAPRSDPDPPAIAVGRPTGLDGVGPPELSVATVVLPYAVLVEVLDAVDLAAHMLVAVRGIDPVIAFPFPEIEIVVGRVGDRPIGSPAQRPIDHGAGVRVQLVSILADVNGRLAASDPDRGPSAGLDVDAVAPRTLENDRRARAVDLDVTSVRVLPEPHDGASDRHAHLGRVGRHLDEIELGLGTESNVCTRRELDLGASADAGVEGVPRHQRCVDGNPGPVVAIAEAIRGGAVDEAHSSDTGRVVFGEGQRRPEPCNENEDE